MLFYYSKSRNRDSFFKNIGFFFFFNFNFYPRCLIGRKGEKSSAICCSELFYDKPYSYFVNSFTKISIISHIIHLF